MSEQNGPASDAPVAFDEQPGDIQISNEFAVVLIRRVETRNGARLRIISPRLRTSIDLDALALESLTWQTMETFSHFLSTPFGDKGQ